MGKDIGQLRRMLRAAPNGLLRIPIPRRSASLYNPSVIDTLIAAVRAGKLDERLVLAGNNSAKRKAA